MQELLAHHVLNGLQSRMRVIGKKSFQKLLRPELVLKPVLRNLVLGELAVFFTDKKDS